MKRTLALAILGLFASTAEAKVKVVTTVQTFKAITEYIGGNQVSVTALVGDSVDPHKVDPKPSYALALNKADLLIHVGLDLEIGWLPPLLDQARNPDIQKGKTGNLDASQAIADIRDVGGSTSRTEGDIHPLGNPHYWIPPDNGVAVAKLITERLSTIDPDHADKYQERFEKFKKKVAARATKWAESKKKLKGVKVVTYHKSWSYVTSWLGMDEIGYVEPKPGVPPDSAHLAELVKKAKKQGAKMVIVESFYSQNTAQRVAELGGMKLVVLTPDTSSTLRTYFDLVDYIVVQLAAAAE